MNKKITRKAKLSDLETIVGLWYDFMRLHDKIVLKKNKRLKPHLLMKKDAKDKFRRFCKRMIYSKKGLVLVAEIEGKIVGYSLSFIKKYIKIYNLDRTGYISDMYIDPKFQGKNLSTQLIKETFKWFKSKGLKYAELTVFNDNEHAHSIYRHWGFFDYSRQMRMKI